MDCFVGGVSGIVTCSLSVSMEEEEDGPSGELVARHWSDLAVDLCG